MPGQEEVKQAKAIQTKVLFPSLLTVQFPPDSTICSGSPKMILRFLKLFVTPSLLCPVPDNVMPWIFGHSPGLAEEL